MCGVGFAPTKGIAQLFYRQLRLAAPAPTLIQTNPTKNLAPILNFFHSEQGRGFFPALPPCFDYFLHQKSRSKRDSKLEGNNPYFSSSPFPTNSSAFTGAPVSDLIVAALQGNSPSFVRSVFHHPPNLFCHQSQATSLLLSLSTCQCSYFKGWLNDSQICLAWAILIQ